MDRATPTLTMQDVADLARVRRSTVSMWRSRPRARGQPIPFPEPLQSGDGAERFDRKEIVDWLDRSGRGNNHHHRLDAPALSPPPGGSLEELVALLCLQVSARQELAGSTAAEREAWARASDPGDTFLVSEVMAATTTKESLLFIDDLVEASYGAAEALGRLEKGQPGRAMGARDLTSGAVDLLRAVTRTALLHLGSEDVALVYCGGSPKLALSLAVDFAYLVVPGDGAEAADADEERALRRRAVICGIEMATDPAGPSVRLLSVLGREPDRALDKADGVVVDLGPGDVAVILGAASIMCDELRGEPELKRSQTLRLNHLRLALRLMRGMWREAHRQTLGLWVCAGGSPAPLPYVADLAAFSRDELSSTDLAADVAGALAHGQARAFRYARRREMQLVLSTRVVVPRGTRAIQLGTTNVTPYLDRIHAATLLTAEPVPAFDILAAPAPGSVFVRRHSLAEMRDLDHVRVLRGSRIDAAHASPDGSVAVLSATGETGEIRLDPFDVIRLYPRAARTEPGDVVFVERPRPLARVDVPGGSLVASPSRILRMGPAAGIGPHAMAAMINRLPDAAGEWEAWSTPVLDADAATQLENALTSAAGYQESLSQRLGAMDGLIGAMIDGVAAGAVTLSPQTD